MGVLDPPLNPAKYEDEIAFSADLTNVNFALSINVLTPLAPTLALPPSTFPVTLQFDLSMTLQAGGAGLLGCVLQDVTIAATPKVLKYSTRGATFPLGGFSFIQDGFYNEVRVDPSATWRFYRLYGAVYRDVGSSLTAVQQACGAASASSMEGFRMAYIRAVKG